MAPFGSFFSGNSQAERLDEAGVPLRLRADSPATMVDALIAAANQRPSHGVTYTDVRHAQSQQTYPELLDEAPRIAHSMSLLGLQRGDKVLLQLDCNREFVPVFLGV